MGKLYTATIDRLNDEITRLRELEQLIANPIDPDREAARASRYGFAMDRGKVLRLPRIGGGSFYTGTQMEVLYASAVAGNNLATFTTEATMYAATQPEALLPSGFFDPTYGVNYRTLRVTLRGVWSDTTSAPTFTVGFRQDSVSGGIWGSTAAMTALGVSQTNVVWELEFDITSQSGSFASSHNEAVLVVLGQCSNVASTSQAFANASAIGTLTPTTAFTLTQTDASHYLVPTITCGTSNASNKWQMLQALVFGCN